MYLLIFIIIIIIINAMESTLVNFGFFIESATEPL